MLSIKRSAESRRRKLSAATALPIEHLENRLLLSSTFAVASTSLPASGPVTLPFNSIDVTFNQDVSPGSVSPANLSLNLGTVTGATLTSPDTVHYTLAGINAETTVTAIIAAGVISDTSGDMVQAFSSSFATDVGTIPFMEALTPVGPAGSLADSGTVTGSIGAAGDTDTFMLDLGAGELLSLALQSKSPLQPSMQLFDPGGNLLGRSVAGTGATALLQSQQISASGTYAITVTGAAASTGAYTLTALLNAVTQPQMLGGPANSSMATAMNLDSSFVGLGGGSGQATLFGSIGLGQTDYYCLTLNGGDSVSLTSQASGSSPPEIEIVDADSLPRAQGTRLYNTQFQSAISDFVAPQAGTYYVALNNGIANYTILVTRNAEFNYTVSSQSFASSLVAGTLRGVGGLGNSYGGPYQSNAFGITLQKGSTLRAWTSLPPEGLSGVADTLDPDLLLTFNNAIIAENDNAAPDGVNAELTYTATSTGTYSLIVTSSASGGRAVGDYILNVQGAGPLITPLTVSSTPTTGTRYQSPPAQLIFLSNESIALNSLQASALSIDGTPALGVTVTGGTTLSFTMPTGLSQGTHSYTIAAGAFTSLAGSPVAAVNGQFTLDSIPPRIISSSIQEGDTVPAGNLTFVAQFSEPVRANAALSQCVTLVDGLSHSTFAPTSISFDSFGTLLTATYANLPDDTYTLTLSGSYPNALMDMSYNLLDGEPYFPMPPNQSGDGKAGGDFVVHFTADATAVPLSGLKPILPLAGNGFTASTTGLIGTASDTDAYTVTLSAGESLTALLSAPGYPMVPSVSITDPSGNVLAEGVASGIGQSERILIAPVDTAGTYTITVASESGTGAYILQTAVNAVFQNSMGGGPANHTPGSAQDLNSDSTAAGGQLQQTDVMGALDGGPPLPQENEPNDTLGAATDRCIKKFT